MNIPGVGFELLSILGLLFLLGVILVLAYVWDPVRQLPGVNALPKQTALIIGILLIVGTLSYGGVLTAPQDDVEEPTDFYSVTDLNIYGYDEDDGTQLTGDIYVYEPGAEDDEYVKQTADTLRTGELSSGSVEFTGWDAEKYPEATFVYEGSDYYQTIDTEDVRVEKSAEENAKSITIRADKIGTIDGSTTETTPDWNTTTDDDISYNIYVENTASDTVLKNVAIEWDVNNNDAVDLLSVDDGGHIEEVDDTEYIVLDNTDLEGGEVEVISVSVNPEDDSEDLKLAFDDLFAQFGADEFQTHSDVNSVSEHTQTISWSDP